MTYIKTSRQLLVERVSKPLSVFRRETGILTALDVYALHRMQEALSMIGQLSREDLTAEGKQFIYDLANHAQAIPDHVGNWHSQRSWPKITDADFNQKSYENELMQLDAVTHAYRHHEDHKRLTVSARVPQVASRVALRWTISGVVGGLLGGLFVGQFFVG